MPAFQQDVAGPHALQGSARLLHGRFIPDDNAGQRLCLGNIGGQQIGKRQQGGTKCRYGRRVDQVGAPFGDHYRIDDQQFLPVPGNGSGNHGDDFRRKEHAALDHVNLHIGQHGFQLQRCELRRRGVDTVHAASVLGGECRDDRGSV